MLTRSQYPIHGEGSRLDPRFVVLRSYRNCGRKSDAPKGQKDSARGFNPGLANPKGGALKAAQELRTASSICGGYGFSQTLRTSGATFRAHLLVTRNLGLKPQAESFCPFGAIIALASHGNIIPELCHPKN